MSTVDERPDTMRAMVIEATGEPEALQLHETPMARRFGAEALVRVHAAGVNPIDAKTRAGRGVAAGLSLPAILGNDYSGTLVEVPYRDFRLAVGDQVYGMAQVPRTPGSYAEYLAAGLMGLARKPANLSHTEAAAVPLAALTAWGMLVDVAHLREGQRVLVHAAAGGVGHFVVQFARYFGAHVIATASTRNHDFLRSLGATETIDYRTERFEELVDGVDAVIDLIGNVQDATGTRSLQVLRPGGILVNAPTGSWPEMPQEAEAAGVRASGYIVTADGARLAAITELIEQGEVRVEVERVFPLAEAAEAHRVLEQGHVRGKLVLDVGGPTA